MASGKKKITQMASSAMFQIQKVYLAIVNKVPFVSCCTYQWAKDKTCPIKGYFRTSNKMGFSTK